MGKSTSAQLLARDHGYVYYEADCFFALKNPYVPVDAEDPSMAQRYQKVLRGEGMEERREVVQRTQGVWGNLMAGKGYDEGVLDEYYCHLAADIAREKKRIGGNWAVATALLTASVRAVIRFVFNTQTQP